tara:strand:- start:50757 stop:51743 length:987 start_codon:yes stop_codon:yes gene_type:complete
MDIRDLGRLDMNLLVALEALLEERSVSRAADRLFITQSAMSKTLSRLRDVFDDPLFIRKASEMVPTPRAEQLAEHLPQVLRAVQSLIAPVAFDPLRYEGEFDLLVQGHMGVWIVPLLLEQLQVTAPRVRLRVLSDAGDPLDRLASGELDYVLHAEFRHYPDDYRLTTLGFAPPVLLARKGHPLEGKQLTWEMLAPYPHLRLIIPELSDVQLQLLEGSELLRRESQVTPNLYTDDLYTAVRVVMTSDYLFPAPPMFMEQDDLSRGLVALPLPAGDELVIKYVMVTHERIEHSPAHAFLRGEILQAVDRFRHSNGLPCMDDLRVQRNLPY